MERETFGPTKSANAVVWSIVVLSLVGMVAAFVIGIGVGINFMQASATGAPTGNAESGRASTVTTPVPLPAPTIPKFEGSSALTDSAVSIESEGFYLHTHNGVDVLVDGTAAHPWLDTVTVTGGALLNPGGDYRAYSDVALTGPGWTCFMESNVPPVTRCHDYRWGPVQ